MTIRTLFIVTFTGLALAGGVARAQWTDSDEPQAPEVVQCLGKSQAERCGTGMTCQMGRCTRNTRKGRTLHFECLRCQPEPVFKAASCTVAPRSSAGEGLALTGALFLAGALLLRRFRRR